MTLMNPIRQEIWATDSNVALTFTGTLKVSSRHSLTPARNSASC
jgi:hypothetical protein